jgi:hypothetical protein
MKWMKGFGLADTVGRFRFPYKDRSSRPVTQPLQRLFFSAGQETALLNVSELQSRAGMRSASTFSIQMMIGIEQRS